MAIPSQVARLILREHRFRPITGKLLTIGRQTVFLTPSQAISLVQTELGTQIDVDPSDLEIDVSTRASRGRGYISDRAFFSLFSDLEYHCLDVSDYEDANIVFNICNPDLPAELENNFDFIFDGSTLDNVFDPAAALRNLARMTTSPGRLIHLNHVSRRHTEYVAFALSWFHDYYSINEFDDCQVYLAQWDEDQFKSRWDLYHYNPLREQDGVVKLFGQDSYYYPWRRAHAVVIADKGNHSTWTHCPVQYQYRQNIPNAYIQGKFETLPQDLTENSNDPYVRAALRFSRSLRPPLARPEEKAALPEQYLHYAPQIVYCGSLLPIEQQPRQ